MRLTPRKTQREVRLEERLRGFYDCLSIFEELWRQSGNKTWSPERPPWDNPICAKLWEGIEAAQAKIRPADDEYKALQQHRLEGLSAVELLAAVVRNR